MIFNDNNCSWINDLIPRKKHKTLANQNFGYGRAARGNFVHGDAKEQRLKNPQYKVKNVTDFKHLGRVAPLSDKTLAKMKDWKLGTVGAIHLRT